MKINRINEDPELRKLQVAHRLIMLLKRMYSSFPSSLNLEIGILRKKMKYLATKRGIVENEIIFDKFMRAHFEQLKEHEIILFNDLLQEYDWDIFAWITGQRKAPEKYCDSELLKLLKDCSLKK